MMSWLAIAAIGLSQSDDRPRIKEELANGVKILASREDQSGTGKATVVFFASRKGLADDAGSMSLRHFVEHILVKGPDKNMDRDLERNGVLLSAASTRNGLTITVSGPATQLPIMVSKLGGAVSSFHTTEEEVAREAEILRQERFVLPEWWELHSSAWKLGFGDEVDPYGRVTDFGVIKGEHVEGMYRQMINGATSAVVVYGDIVPAIAIERCKEAFGGLQKGSVSGLPRPADQFVGSTRSSGNGESRSAVVPGLRNGSTIAAVGAALVFADRFGGRVVYEPSIDAGLVTIWNPKVMAFSGIDQIPAGELSGLFQEVRAAARSWSEGLTRTRESWAMNESIFLRDGGVTTLPLIQSFANGLTDGEIELALNGFRTGKCLEVTGR